MGNVFFEEEKIAHFGGLKNDLKNFISNFLFAIDL